MSSWSIPIVLAPLAPMVPMTWQLMLSTRIWAPRGLSAPNRARWMVAPITQTAAPDFSSASVDPVVTRELVDGRIVESRVSDGVVSEYVRICRMPDR